MRKMSGVSAGCNRSCGEESTEIKLTTTEGQGQSKGRVVQVKMMIADRPEQPPRVYSFQAPVFGVVV